MKNNNIDKLDEIIGTLRVSIRRCESDLKDYERYLEKIEKHTKISKIFINTPRDFDFLGSSKSNILYDVVEHPFRVSHIVISSLLAIGFWYVFFPISPYNLSDGLGYTHFWMWALSILSLVALVVGFAYFTSAIHQCILTLIKMSEFKKEYNEKIEGVKNKLSDLDSMVRTYTTLVDIASTAEISGANSEYLKESIDKAVDIAIGIGTDLDCFKSQGSRVISLVNKASSIVTSIENLEKYSFDSKTENLIFQLEAGAMKMAEHAGIYKDRLKKIIKKAKRAVSIADRSNADTLDNIINIVIPEIGKLCTARDDVESGDIVEVLDLTEEKLDSILGEANRMLEINESSTVSALKKMLQ